MSKDFKPYIPEDAEVKEFTVVSVVIGIILAVVFGAANAYLGLRVGQTVSASIPAAVISMGVMRKILRRKSILENNMVQTIGSAGESVAAGVVFTVPALFLWAKEDVIPTPQLLPVCVLALCGGVLGVLFMIPLRKALIVKEHETLPFPEGTACAEVLLAGEKDDASSKSIFLGMLFASVIEFVVEGFGLVANTVVAKLNNFKTSVEINVSPALIGVGYICGPKISSYLFAGGILSRLVLIPAIVLFGADTVLYPGTEKIADIFDVGGAQAIWSNYIRYIGAGALATAGIITLIKTLPLMIKTFVDAIKTIQSQKGDSKFKVKISRTDRDLDVRIIIGVILAVIILLCLLPNVPVNFFSALLIVIFGFFFGAVASRMAGLIGSSNNPVSGMTIASLIVSVVILRAVGVTGERGMIGAIAIATIICIIAAIAGDTSQDLKTGFLLGATPIKQQIGEIIGVIASSAAIGGIIILLDNAWGFGSDALPAPQATLMKVITEGVMNSNLPWELIFIGVFIAIVIEIIGVPVLPVVLGIYLPLGLSTSMMVGGVIKYLVDKRNSNSEQKESDDGVLFSSGMIAGEGIVGVILAILTVTGISTKINMSEKFSLGNIGGVVMLSIMAIILYKIAVKKKKLNN